MILEVETIKKDNSITELNINFQIVSNSKLPNNQMEFRK